MVALRWLLLLAVLPCAGSTPPLHLDFTPAQAWLARARQGGLPEAWAKASEATQGGRFARAAASTFGPEPGPATTPPNPAHVAALLREMQTWKPEAMVRALAGLFPRPLPGTLAVHVVANGHPSGDAYVRSFSTSHGRPVLDPEGRPRAILNILAIASYPGDPGAQAKGAEEVLRHEAFHVLFRRFRALDPSWRGLQDPLDAHQELLLLLLDEGIGHFLAEEEALGRTGFPFEKGVRAFARLDAAVKDLAQNRSEAEAILRDANTGSYWDKFGSISGMLLVYGVHRTSGLEGLREAIARGPLVLLERYAEATAKTPELPPLPSGILAWARLHGRNLPPPQAALPGGGHPPRIPNGL